MMKTYLRTPGPTTAVYRVSCRRFTVLVEVDATGTIIRTAPVTRRFVGQQLTNLFAWFRGFGGLEFQRLGSEEA